MVKRILDFLLALILLVPALIVMIPLAVWVKLDSKGKKWAYMKIVCNKDRYRLTHLLEKSHRLRNGRKSRPQPHIAPVEQKAVENLIKYIKEGV